MPTYHLNLDQSPRPLLTGHLQLGGQNRLGESIGVTSQYLTRSGKPFFGISGEFQYSRYPAEYWEDELLKMKAGGINTVATYCFWIHHEPHPGEFDWSGRRNLRRFVELCAKHDLWVIARLGPFAHGECRNGGLPDWLYGMPFSVRSNEPAYLEWVSRYYQQIGYQLRGLTFQEGGPVVCIQLDNEYEHTGAPWDTADRSAPVEWLPRGNGGVEHMQHLKRIAAEAGLVTPLYTVTGWGSPVIEDEVLPVYGGYAYPVWVENPGPSSLFRFNDTQAHPHPDAHHKLPYYYPLINAEMQGGIQVRYHNRPVVPPRSTEALALVQIGCGSNFLGYYIYHGGSNPFQDGSYTNEVLHPRVSYDFQAPIGEYGDVRDSCRGLKILHLFLESFGERLAAMPPLFPEGAGEIDPTDTHTLRFSARAKDGSGFLFLNNYQDHLETQPIAGIRFDLALGGETIQVPRTGELTLHPEVSCIFPLNLPLAGARLVYATAQPLTMLESAGGCHFFFYAPDGIRPEYCFEINGEMTLAGETGEVVEVGDRVYLSPPVGLEHAFHFTSPDGRRVQVTTLTRREAEHTWRGTAWGQPRLVISEADLIFVDGGVELHSIGQPNMEMAVFPPVEVQTAPGRAAVRQESSDRFTCLRACAPPAETSIQPEPCGEGKIMLRFPHNLMDDAGDVFASIDYTGDIAGAFINGQLVADHYNNGTPWLIGLKRFIPGIFEQGLLLSFRPLRKGVIKNVSNAMAARMDFEGETRLEVHSIRLIPEYVFRL